MSTITITGTVLSLDGVTPKSGGTLKVRKVIKDGVLLTTADKAVTIGTEGEVSFTLPRGCTAWIDGPVEGFNKSGGVAVTIPNAATAKLEDLLPAVSPPSTAVSQAALQAETARATAAEGSLDTRVDALEAGGSGGGAWGDITGTLSDQTDLQTALDAKADGSALTAEASARANADTTLASSITAVSDAVTALDTDLDAETAARIAGDSAEATARANADALLQPLAEKNQANGYAGLDGSGLIPDIRLPASIARDSEVTSAVAAEASARDSAISAASTTDRDRANHTGTQSADTLTDGTTNKAFTATEQTKLAGVATGATANATDAQLRDRSTHTGTQTASTVSDFNSAALAAAPAETTTTTGTLISGATSKTTPVDADSVALSDSAASNVLKKLTWANLKATLKTYFDTLYQAAAQALTDIAGLTPSNDDFLQRKAGAWANRTIAQVKGDLSITNFGVTGPTAARTYTFPDAAATIARTDAAQTFTGNQTISGNILANTEGTNVIGAAAANRFGAYLYGLNIGNTGAISAGTFKFGATTNGIQMQSGFLQLGSGVGLGWSSGDVFSVGEDTKIKRAKAAVIDLTNASTGGGTFRAVATSPTQITADQNNYALGSGAPSYFIRLTSDASRSITGLSISQVDGEVHTVVNVGSNNIVLVNESASSTAANRFTNSTGADITLAAKQAADLIYDGTTSRWLVFKRN